MEIFSRKKNLRVIRIGNIDRLQEFVGQRCVEFKSLIDGGIIAQWSFVPQARTRADLKPARCEANGKVYQTNRMPTDREYEDLLFGWLVESGITSNSVHLRQRPGHRGYRHRRAGPGRRGGDCPGQGLPQTGRPLLLRSLADTLQRPERSGSKSRDRRPRGSRKGRTHRCLHGQRRILSRSGTAWMWVSAKVLPP